ncbi:hypothetical protein YPPY100_0926, partial [Yersinia pestis PY-100]
MAGLRIRLSE